MRWKTAATVAATVTAVGLGAAVSTPGQAVGRYDAGFVATGTVIKVSDGDTFLGRIAREGPGTWRIRLSGIQAMERGECGSNEAQRALTRMLPAKSAVTVKARYKASRVPNYKEAKPRPLRLAFNRAGVDVQAELLRTGLVLPNIMRRETINEDVYWRTGQEAAINRAGLFSGTMCGAGPAPEAALRIMINYNADGNDRQNPNGKYARILNDGVAPVDISGWHLRTARHAKFVFPSGTVLVPGGEVLIHQGSGTNGGGRFYWGNAQAFTNPEASRYRFGGGYLVDPDGDLRAWTLYPCQVNCVNPLAGKIRLSAIHDPEGNENDNPNAEMIKVTNVVAEQISLDYTVMEVGDGEVIEFPRGTFLDPGETLSVHIGRGTAERLHHYLGRDTSILPNGPEGGWALIRTHEAIRVDCVKWGNAHC